MSEKEQEAKEQDEYDAWVGRERPHKFKNLSQSLADVEVQQLNTNVAIRDAPREGHKSYISEEIAQHKDTVGAKHWTEAVAALNDSVQSLELVVLHRETILSILLQQSVPAAKLSIPALLGVLTAFSKDLQADFVPFFPRVFDHLAMLATGLVRDAQCLEAIFASVSSMLKNIHKHLQSKLPWIFRVSRQLRYHSSHHVRVFAAEAFGYMLRKAPVKKLPKVVAAVVSEGVATNDIERVHGAAQLLAVSIIGPSYTLHSRAEPVLAALFSMSSLKADSSLHIAALQTAVGQRRLAAIIITAVDKLLDHTRRAKGASLLWEVSLASVSSALAHANTTSSHITSSHPTSGPSTSTPTATGADLQPPTEAMPTDERSVAIIGTPEPASAAAAITHSIAIVCHAVEYIRGSRVDDYTQLFRLLSTLMHSPHAWPQSPNTSTLPRTSKVATGVDEFYLPTLVVTQSDSTADAAALAKATAPQQVLRLALSIIHAHGKIAGASGGPDSLRTLSRQHAWGTLFTSAAPQDLYAFVSALLQPPTGVEVLGMFSKPLVAALTQCVHASGSDYVMLDVPLGLLTEVLSRVVAEAGGFSREKESGHGGVLLEGDEGGNSSNHTVIDVVGNILEAFLASEDVQQRHIVNDCGAAAAAVAALQCMARMHAVSDDSLRALSLSKAAFDAMISCLSSHSCMHVAQHACSSSAGVEKLSQGTGAEGSCCVGHLNAASVLLAATESLLACALAPRVATGVQGAPVDTVGIARQLIMQLLSRPSSYVLLVGVASVAETLGCARMRGVVPQAQRTALRDALICNLVACSRAVRAATLRVILRCELFYNSSTTADSTVALAEAGASSVVVGTGTHVEAAHEGVVAVEVDAAMTVVASKADGGGDGLQVEMHAYVGDVVHAPEAAGGGSVFVQGFLDCEDRQMDLHGGRAAVAWLKRVAANLEYGQVPAVQLPLVVSCLLGMGYIKYSELRPPLATALAAAIEKQPKVTWPLFLVFLRTTQNQFLLPTAPSLSSIPPTSPLNPLSLTSEHPPFSLRRLFQQVACSGTSEASGGFSDSSAVLGILLKTLTVAPVQCIERMHSSWHDLATTLIASRTHDPCERGGSTNTCDPAHPTRTDPLSETTGACDVAEHTRTEASEIETETLPESSSSGSFGPRAKDWRARLTDWLQLVARLKGTKNFQKAREWPAIITPHLSSIDPQVQRAALDALATLRQPPSLSRYLPQLTTMTEPKRIKNALTRFSLEAGADNGIASCDRTEVLPIVIRMLLPLLRRRTGKRGASDIPAPPSSARPAVLNRLAALESRELSTLVHLSLDPHRHLFPPTPPTPPASKPHTLHDQTAPTVATVVASADSAQPWWHAELACDDAAMWLEAVTVDAVAACPLGRRKALLNTISDLISHLGFRMQPFLPLLTSLIVRTLQAACGHTGDRAQRSGSIQLLATVLSRFPVSFVWQPLWPEVLPVLAPLAATLADDSAAGGKSPSVLTLMHALATSPALLPVLADRQSMHEPPAFLHRMEEDSQVQLRANVRDARMISMHGDSDEEDNAENDKDEEEEDLNLDDDMHEERASHKKTVKRNDQTATPTDDLTSEAVDAAVPVCLDAWAQQHCGSNLVAAAVDAFSRSGTTPRVRNAAFLVLEALATVHRPGARLILSPHTPKLLPAIQEQLVRTVEGVSVVRCVGLLHRLVPLVEDSADCVAPLSAALATAACGRRGGERRAAAALTALAALWCRSSFNANTNKNVSSSDTALIQQAPRSFSATNDDNRTAQKAPADAAAAAVAAAAVQLAPLGAKLETREARSALADAITAGCALVPGLTAGAKILQQVTSFSTSTLDEADYDARLAGYSALSVECWGTLPALSASIAMHACFTDLRAPDDLALRSAAASALSCMIDAAATASVTSTTTEPPDSTATGLGAQNQAVTCSDVAAHGRKGGVVSLPLTQKEGQEGLCEVLKLVSTRLYRQLLALVVSEVLVVRQEALALLRRCAEMLPETFPDLVALSHADPEADFFLNVAHIQMHRRARAFYRLAVAISATASSSDASRGENNVPQEDSSDPSKLQLQQSSKSREMGEGGPGSEEVQIEGHNASANSTGGSQKDSQKESEKQEAGGLLSLGTLQALVVPLIVSVVNESRGAATGAGGHGIKKGAADRALNVVDAAVQALHAVASRLAWPQYRNILSRFLNLSGGAGRNAPKGDAAKVVQRNALRAVCAVIDAFHFVPQGTRLNTAPLLSTDKLSLAAKVAKAGNEDRGGDQQHKKPKQGHPVAEGSKVVVEGGDAKGKGDQEHSAEAGTSTGKSEEKLLDGAVHDQTAKLLSNETNGEPGLEEEQQEDVLEEGEGKGDEEMEPSDGRKSGGKKEAATAAEIQRAIVLRVLPSMLALMHKDKDTVRAPVALAIVKLLRVLPEAAELMHLPKVLQNVANLLAERLQSTRDNARNVLINIVKELGPEYMQPVAAVLSAALPARGFTAHVLGYTLHACLQALVDIGSEAGSLDSCLEELLPLMEAGLFTPIAEQKKAAAYASKHRETKSQKAFITFELLAQLCTFSSHVEVLLLPVRERLPDAAAPHTRNVLVRLLQHATLGVAANAHACSDDVLLFVYRQLKRSAAADDARKDLEASVAYADAAPSTGNVSKATAAQQASKQHNPEEWQPNEEIITEFALSILSQWVRKGKLDVAHDQHTRSRVAPLLAKLAAGVGLRSTTCAQLCLKCLTGLVPAGLPGMSVAAQEASMHVWKILSNRQRLDSQLSQDCLKLVASLLRGCGEWDPPVRELRALVGGAYADITTASAALLGVLRAVLGRKLVEVIEVYDVMKRIQEQLVKSPDATMRSTCAATLLQFLLDWPLQDHRLTQHLEFVLSNLSFELEDGRLQVLELVESMIMKFPAAAVDSRFAVFFVPLAQRLHSETSPECRRRLDGTISALLQRCTAGSRGVAVEWCCKWLQSWDGRMRTVSAQVIGILATVEGKAFPKRLPALKPILIEQLQAACLVQSVVAGDDEEGARSAPGWREAYFLMLLIDKVFAAAPKCLLITEDDEGIQNENIWRAVLSLLSHRHFWVQKAACRAFSSALAHAPLAEHLMALPQLPASAALELFSHFEACAGDAGAATQAVKCMVAIASAVYACEVKENNGTLAQLGDLKAKRRRLNGEGDGKVGHAEVENVTANEEDVASDIDEGENSTEDEDEEAEQDDMHDGEALASTTRMRAVTLCGLFKRVSRYAADRRESVLVLRIGALQWLAAVAKRLGGAKLTAHDSVLMTAVARPLYQIQEGTGLDGEQVTEWAAQVAEVLREEVGAESLAAAMNAARGAISAAKVKRKRAVALQAVVDPEAAAQRRLRRSEKRTGERKRKAGLEKRQRDAGVARGGARDGIGSDAGSNGNKKHKRRER